MANQVNPEGAENTLQSQPRRSRGVVAAVLLAVLAGLAIWYAWPSPQPAKKATSGDTAVSVLAEVVAVGNIDTTIDALGTVTSLATVSVRTQVAGQLVEVDFKEGQDVKKGDVLAKLDNAFYSAALDQAKGQLARDQALLDGANVDLKRYTGLEAESVVSGQTLDTQKALVAQYQGTVEDDKAAIQAAAVNLAYTDILAPADGRAGLRQVDSGNYVTPGDATPIVVITQLEPISVVFTVPEDRLGHIAQRLTAGDSLAVKAYDRSGSKVLATGTLASFDSQIDPTTGTIKMRATFSNDDRSLYPNQFVNIVLTVDEHQNVPLINVASVQRGVPGTYVYLVNGDQTVTATKVGLGVTSGDKVEVVSGLKTGDRVVIDGADKLRDGAKIKLMQENTTAAPATGNAAATPAQPQGTGQPQ